MARKISEQTADAQLQQILLSNDDVRSRSTTEQTTRPGPLSQGWRSGMLCAIGIVGFALCINITSVVILATKYGVDSGIGTILTAPCDTISKWSTGSHICINVLGSLLLSASNYSMQSICAPTRSDLDKAHSKGDWLDIGIPSIRNLFGRISPARTLLYALLGLSSLPLHLLYNSAIFKTTVSNSYNVLVAPPDFLHNTSYMSTANLDSDNSCRDNAPNNLSSHNFQLCRAYYQALASTLGFFINSTTDDQLVKNLTKSECIAAYSHQILPQLSDLLLISSGPNLPQADSALVPGQQWATDHSDPTLWITSDCIDTTKGPCNTKHLEKPDVPWTVEGWNIEYCLARREESKCSLRFSTYILAAVAACNIIKLAAMTWILVMNNEETLVTLGDTMASYLSRPDPYTAGICLYDGRRLKQGLPGHKTPRSQGQICEARPTKYCSSRKRRWLEAVSAKRGCVTMGLCVLVILTAMILLREGFEYIVDITVFVNPFRMGFGTLDSRTAPAQLPFAFAVLIANTPQLIISVLYVNYNGLWTAMLLASEWNDRCTRPKPLRVSSPKGQQRATYWLQLPFTYSIPIITAMTCLHWLISEGLFSAQVEVMVGDYDNFGDPQPKHMSVIAYSCLPILLSIIWGSLMVITVVAAGFRRFTNPIPIASSCSLAIAAACHRPKEDMYAAYLAVSWGEVDFDGEIGHCCFTSQPVQEPTPGRLYAGQRSGHKRLFQSEIDHLDETRA